jgi:hypothetical protein
MEDAYLEAIPRSFAGLVGAFEMPARQSLIALMVERRYLVSAISLNSTAFNASKVINFKPAKRLP